MKAHSKRDEESDGEILKVSGNVDYRRGKISITEGRELGCHAQGKMLDLRSPA